jgi:hypothetical protein
MQWLNQVHMRSDQPLRTTLARMRHEHCRSRAARAVLVSGAKGISSLPVWRIDFKGKWHLEPY